ncbi:hypothetical protein JCM11491_000265 [Sporobolomyces phaffii]
MATTTTAFSFGSYDWVCNRAALIVCPLLGETSYGIEPVCYSRNVEFGKTLVFQPATSFLHICALLMVIIMVLHVRSKYTAVGRKEILVFFYLYFAVELVAIFLDSSIIPTSSSVYPYFAAIHLGLVCCAYWALLVNGFVGFQVVEDGTPVSLWTLHGTTFVVGIITGLIALATFKNSAGLSAAKPTALFVFEFVFPLACVAIYVGAQLLLVVRTLDDRWPLLDIAFGCFFFIAAQVLFYGFSNTICDQASHYIDGTFFHTLCTLFGTMMVYKYWCSITKEDLEFSVGSKMGAWEVKGLLHDDAPDEVLSSTTQPHHHHHVNIHPSRGTLHDGRGQVAAGYPPQKGYASAGAGYGY